MRLRGLVVLMLIGLRSCFMLRSVNIYAHTHTALPGCAPYGRLEWDRVAPTMIANIAPGSGRFGHPDVPRLLTMREVARLQTFPDCFEFVDGDADWSVMKSFDSVYRLIGNAVPPRFAEQLAGGLL